MGHSVDFFDRQFRRQIENADFGLNPFEQRVLPHLSGDVLDVGCGLGNLSLAAAQRGCRVDAFDASQAGIERLRDAAARLELPVAARCADLAREAIAGSYDAVVAIGLLMFFPRARAQELLSMVAACTRPGGIVAVNVLIAGTTYLDMFAANEYTLFEADELERFFAAWHLIESRRDGFDAPGGMRKEFTTVIARRPS